MNAIKQAEIDEQNAQFWNDLCGSGQAAVLGITDGSVASLKKYDDYYLNYYPYLLERVPVRTMKDKDVLEIGLGYGTLSQKIAEAGARYQGLDIAAGPVEMVNSRMRQHRLTGKAVQGSMLQCPFPDQSFDCVVSIGCFHHTGNAQRCIDETFRVLRPGGHAYLMLYNRFSLRQWQEYPRETRAALFKELLGRPTSAVAASESQRAAYDTDSAGRAAPETEFFSTRDVKRMMRLFSRVRVAKENADNVFDKQTGELLKPRLERLSTVGRWLGLDLYIHATK